MPAPPSSAMTRAILRKILGILSMAWRLLGLLTALFLIPAPASAHAIIVESLPTVNATVPGPDLDVLLRFNSRIDRARSSVSLTAAGTPQGAKPVTLPLGAVGTPEVLKTHASGLAPGRYTLRWQVLSVDGHITRGDIPFTVAR